ncbi:MAG TPA: hypothetical protein VFG50_15620, partial [Rhodothermales bacterium]|nr:hypothetical protein [Rhodothermales bacterium]
MGTGFFGSFLTRKDQDGQGDGEQPAVKPVKAGAGRERAALPGHAASRNPGEDPAMSAPAPPAPDGAVDTPVAGGDEEGDAASMSPLDSLMQDKVVVALLKDELVDVPQALLALNKHQQQSDSVLWRVLADAPDVDRNAVFAAAAQVGGYAGVDLSGDAPSTELVAAVLGLFPPAVGAEMFRMGLLPYAFAVDPNSQKHTLTLATHDPSHPEVTAFVRKLPVKVELRYAPAGEVRRHAQRLQASGGAEQAPAHVEQTAEHVAREYRTREVVSAA